MAAKTRLVKKTTRPPALKRGDKIALVCPAGRPESALVLDRCRQVVEEMGFVPVTGEHVLSSHGFMAGKDAERLSDFNRFVRDDTIAGIFCVTGGYGCLHLLPDIDYEYLSQKPKVILGCDDNTALLCAINARTGLITFHGPNLDQVTTRFTFERLLDTVTNTQSGASISFRDRLQAATTVGQMRPYSPVGGVAEGELTGGNLTAFVSLLGTDYAPDTQGRVLLLEDINEQYGILDRWISTLYVSGRLNETSGVVFGSFENCSTRQSTNMLPLADTAGQRLRQLNKPCVFGMPIGQSRDTCTVPIGLEVRLDCHAGTLELSKAAVVK